MFQRWGWVVQWWFVNVVVVEEREREKERERERESGKEERDE